MTVRVDLNGMTQTTEAEVDALARRRDARGHEGSGEGPVYPHLTEGGLVPLIKKSRNAIWRVWSGPWRVGRSDRKKKVGVNVAINIRSDKLAGFSEDSFVRDVSTLLRQYAARHDPE